MQIRLAVLLWLMPLMLNAASGMKIIGKQQFCDLYKLMSSNGFDVTRYLRSTNAVKRGYTCEFKRNSPQMTCNGVKVMLLNNTDYSGITPWISVEDWYKTLRPILYPATIKRKKIVSVMIDMGHGGKDPGAVGAISKEKMITLKVGRRVRQILQANGFKVHMTRNSDIQLPLTEIGKMQRKNKSDLFVSIHVNSASNRSVTGIETYCLTPAGAISSNGGKASSTSYSGNRQDAENILLAWNIQKSLLKRTGAADRGVKRARFAVLKDIDSPGALVEIGFISNREEERKLNDQKYIDKIANGIVDGIINYSRSTIPR